MAKYCIGDFIRDTRERRGFTQEELSYGICSVSSLSRIETGNQRPNNQILDALVERLGTQYGMFTEFVSKEEAKYYELKQNVRRAIIEQNYEELFQLLDEMETCIDSKISYESQYYLYAKGVNCSQNGASNETVMQYFMEAIRITLPDFDGKEPQERNLLTFDEITIINTIASIHASEGRYKTAIQLGLWLKDYMEKKVVDENERKKKYPMIIFNLTNWQAKRKRYWDVIELADCGIEFCIKSGTLRGFPNLLLNKGCALAEVGETEKAKKILLQATIVFESVGEIETSEQIVALAKEKYQIDIWG